MIKKQLLSFAFLLICGIAFSQDLTYTVVNTATGGSSGSIDLNVGGGVAPYTYSWTGPGGYTNNTEDVGGLAYGTYTVTVTDKYCGVATITVFVDNDIASGVNDIGGNPIAVFPNPGNGQVTLSSGKVLDGATFKMIDLSGRVVLKEEGLNGNGFRFDVSQQPNGIYFIEVYNGDVVSRTRFVKN